MTPPLATTWKRNGQQIIRRGRVPISFRDGLVLGVDEPNLATTAVYDASTLTPYNGNIIVNDAGSVLQNMVISGYISVRAANVVIRNCIVQGQNAAPSANVSLIECRVAGVSNCLIEDCTITPQYAHWFWASGITGHDFTARRNHIYGSTDGINVFNNAIWAGGSPAPYDSNVRIEQNLIEDAAFWSASSGGIVHSSDTITHNDLIQHQGGYGTIIRGNSMNARYKRQWGHWRVTNPAVEPYVFTNADGNGGAAVGGPYNGSNFLDRGTGSLITGRYNGGSNSGMLVADDVGPSRRLVFTDNWCYGGNQFINAGGAHYDKTFPELGGVQVYEPAGTFLRNRFDHAQYNQSGSGGDNTWTISFGRAWTPGSTITTGQGTADRNYYLDNAADINFRLAA